MKGKHLFIDTEISQPLEVMDHEDYDLLAVSVIEADFDSSEEPVILYE